MKKDSLEEYIKANRDDFDFREPSPDLWERIEKPVPHKVVSLRKYFYRAAIVLLVVSVGGVLSVALRF